MPTWTMAERIIAFLACIGAVSIVVTVGYAAGQAVDYIKKAARLRQQTKRQHRKTIHINYIRKVTKCKKKNCFKVT